MVSGALKTAVAVSALPELRSEALASAPALRCINIMNFIRAEEPREAMDLFQPVKEQMALIRKYQFPATWLLQYDALVEGPFVEFLKKEMPATHEIGLWFEMNRKICEDAGIAWRGDRNWEWDYHVPIAYAIGYTPAERRKLTDTAMATFRRVFGRDAKTVGSWNLDAVSLSHFSERYRVDAFANCRDQIATDGFTVWGVPIAAYYPCRKNAWSPALERANQISVPMFRLLGQDPVYYYDKQLADPDTMEPVWASGQSQTFAANFLNMIARAPTQFVAYAQLGQENSFGWGRMRAGYAMQMEKLAQVRRQGGLIVETMGETGRRFKRAFQSTPTQAQVMLSDPFGKEEAPQRTVWYQSKYFRANLHFRGDQFYLRDLHVYNDKFAQPYLNDVVRQHGIEQRMLAVLDGYHWSDDAVHAGRNGRRAMGRFVVMNAGGKETPLAMSGVPAVHESGSTLRTTVPLSSGGTLVAVFDEREIAFTLSGAAPHARLALQFEWVPDLSALQTVTAETLKYRFRDFDYAIRVAGGTAAKTTEGARIVSGGTPRLRLIMTQKS